MSIRAEAIEEVIKSHNLNQKLIAASREKDRVIEEQDNLIQKLKAEINVKAGVIFEKDRQRSYLKNQLVELRERLSLKEQAVENLHDVIEARDRVIAEQEKTRKEQSSAIMGQKVAIEEQVDTDLADTLYNFSECRKNTTLAVVAGIVELELASDSGKFDGEFRLVAQLTRKIVELKDNREKMRLIDRFLKNGKKN